MLAAIALGLVFAGIIIWLQERGRPALALVLAALGPWVVVLLLSLHAPRLY